MSDSNFINHETLKNDGFVRSSGCILRQLSPFLEDRWPLDEESMIHWYLYKPLSPNLQSAMQIDDGIWALSSAGAIIGSGVGSHVRINDPRVGKNHAEINSHGSQFMIKSLFVGKWSQSEQSSRFQSFKSKVVPDSVKRIASTSIGSSLHSQNLTAEQIKSCGTYINICADGIRPDYPIEEGDVFFVNGKEFQILSIVPEDYDEEESLSMLEAQLVVPSSQEEPHVRVVKMDTQDPKEQSEDVLDIDDTPVPEQKIEPVDDDDNDQDSCPGTSSSSEQKTNGDQDAPDQHPSDESSSDGDVNHADNSSNYNNTVVSECYSSVVTETVHDGHMPKSSLKSNSERSNKVGAKKVRFLPVVKVKSIETPSTFRFSRSGADVTKGLQQTMSKEFTMPIRDPESTASSPNSTLMRVRILDIEQNKEHEMLIGGSGTDQCLKFTFGSSPQCDVMVDKVENSELMKQANRDYETHGNHEVYACLDAWDGQVWLVDIGSTYLHFNAAFTDTKDVVYEHEEAICPWKIGTNLKVVRECPIGVGDVVYFSNIAYQVGDIVCDGPTSEIALKISHAKHQIPERRDDYNKVMHVNDDGCEAEDEEAKDELNPLVSALTQHRDRRDESNATYVKISTKMGTQIGKFAHSSAKEKTTISCKDFKMSSVNALIHPNGDSFELYNLRSGPNHHVLFLHGRHDIRPPPLHLRKGMTFQVGRNRFKVLDIHVEDDPDEGTAFGRAEKILRKKIRRTSFAGVQVQAGMHETDEDSDQTELSRILNASEPLMCIPQMRNRAGVAAESASSTPPADGEDAAAEAPVATKEVENDGVKVIQWDAEKAALHRIAITKSAFMVKGDAIEEKDLQLADHYITLQAIRGPGRNRIARFTTDRITIGNRVDNSITVRDRSLSAHHCTIIYSHGQYFLVDRASQSGTFAMVNHIEECSILVPGFTFRISNTEFQTMSRFRESGCGIVSELCSVQ